MFIIHPRKVIEAMYQKPKDFVDELRAFFVERICLNEENMILKEHENITFKQILLLMDSVEPIISIDWEYYASFNGFAKLLQEMNIKIMIWLLMKKDIYIVRLKRQKRRIN